LSVELAYGPRINEASVNCLPMVTFTVAKHHHI
jgi:hypothetical protein